MEKTLNICTLVLYNDGDMPEFNFFDVEAEDSGDSFILPCYYLCVFSMILKKEDEGKAKMNKFLSLFHVFSTKYSELEMKTKLIEKYFEHLDQSDCYTERNDDIIKINEPLIKNLIEKEGICFEYQ